MKKLNLIKRLWTDSHEKQKMRGMQKYGILLLLLFTCVAHAYAKVVYYNDNGQSGTPKVYFWGGTSPTTDWDGSPTMTHVTGNIYFYDIGDNTKCIFRYNNASSKTGDLTVPGNSANYMDTYNANSSTAWSTYQVTSTASLSATTPIGIGVNSTITPSLSSNTNQNEIKSTTYSVTTNPGSAGSVTSAGVFSATAAGTYIVTATITYNPKGSSGITKTVKPTKTIIVEDYIYFYAAIPNSWGDRTTTVKLGSTSADALTPYDKTSLASTTQNASSPCVPVYSAVSSTSYYNSGAKYNVYIYKVPESDAGKNVYLGHSSWTYGTAIGTVASGKLYTLTSGDGGGTYMTANAISVNSVTASGPYAINAVSLTSSISAYGTSTANLRTAGGDTFTTTYTLNDVTASTSTVITPSVSNTYTSNTGNLVGTITIDEGDLTAGHTYTLTVKVADNITGKMTSSATSSSFSVTAASTYRLTYYANYSAYGTSGTAPAAADYAQGSTQTVADENTLAMQKYTFTGWNTNQYITGGTHYDAGDDITMSDNINLYAEWTYNVTLNQNGATTSGSTSFVGTWNCSTIPAITNPSRTGYNFIYWNTQANGAGSDVINPSGQLQASKTNWTDENCRFQRKPTSDNKPLYAKWSAKTYTEANNLDKNGGDSHGKYTATYDKTTITINTTPVKSGYHVDGYYKEEGLTNLIATSIGALQASTAYTDASSKWTNDGNVTLFTKWAPNNYTITLNDNGGSGGDGTHAVTFNSATGSLTNAPEKDGYTFAGYWTGSGGTGTQIFNADLTPIQNVSGYTDNTSDKKWIYAGNKTLYAKWTEIKYTVTLVNATASSVSAGCATHPSITASTAPFGMKFDHWDVSGGASVASTTSNPTTVSATAAGTVTAVYTQGLYAYIVCRFETHSKDRQTTYYTGNWNTTATNNEFEYDEANHRFVKHTYTTLAELSANKDGQPQYFEVKTTEAHGNLDHSSVKYYGKSSNTNITTTGYDNRIAMELSEATGHPKFSGSTTDKYVVIYFDENKELWFEEEDIPAVINNISLSDNVVPPGASITATPSMYVRGAVNKAYCWGVYTDEECTEGNKVDVSFNSIGGGKVDFTVPLTTGTYYLKLKVHASAACDVAVDDSKVVSFEVTTTKMIYFKNVPNWSNVYVYFYYGNGASGYWNSSKGTGPMKGGNDRVCSASTMKRIGKSDIYYYQYDTWSGHVVAFADHVENDNEFFDQSQVAYREDFSTCAQMYVPENYIHDYLNEHDTYRTCYYSSNNDNKIRGYWTTYPRVNAGFTIKLYGSADGSQEGEDIAFTQTGTNTYVANVNLDPATHATYYYDLHTCAGDNGVSNTKYTHYGNSGEMKINSSDNWNFYTQIARCRITPAAAGTYKFKLLLSDDGAVQVSVEYPLAVGDYRLVYTDEDHTLHPSRFIRARADGLDTISVWINPDAESPVLKVQQCTAVSPKIIWSNYNWSGSDATGAIDISGYSRGVYNFYLTQNGSNELSVETSKTAPYTGLYYIRCSSVGGGWLGYKTNSDNLMTYTKYAEDKNYGFNYYKAKWVNDAGSDVTYTIACDYSESLCDTLVADAGDDPLNASQAVSIPHNANIRFGWNSLDNTLQRAYINGSTNASDRYLVLKGEHDKIVDENGNAFSVSGLNADETTFVDLNNWIYRVDLKAKPNGGVKVIANYNGNEQFFIGDADNFEKIIGSSEDQWWPLRVTYDFKTNRLMTAWLPSGSQITSNIALNADMMLIREGQNAATQVFFNGSGKAISDIHTIYGVMEFQYDNIVGKFPSWSSPNAYKYLMYYISFPFDVKVSEIFGCGVRGENWIVQKYNGAKRARIGWFAETSTFWETMEGSETMNAYEGYLLLLDRISFNDSGSSLWFKQGEGNSIYLYFPSTSVASGTISEDETTIHVPEHTCTIDRTFDVGGVGTVSHKNTDSHWNVIGTPLFEDKTAASIATPSADGAGATTLQYYYAWNSGDNTLAAQAAFDEDVEFKSMHSYMVQYAGDVTFSGAKLTPPPASVAARRIPGDKKNYRIKLRMMNEDGNRSETFVELRENACDTFALNEDMYMMRSSTTVDLYTFAGAYDVAANVLSMNNHIVPVGMDVKRAGTYRFTMPSDFSGTVTLIDTETGIRTSLSLNDYEVALPKGTSNNRFFLEINIHQMPTAIDGAGGSLKDGKAHKFIENGQMYILQNGAIYDARGNRVK